MKKTHQNKPLDKEKKSKKNSLTNGNGEIPYGREAVKIAILDAAEKLLLNKIPNKITVREIAEAANVKHPLIHRHFGTKEEVIRAVHARNIENTARRVINLDSLEGNAGFIFEAVKKNRFRQIALSRAMIDGVDLHLVQTDYPVMRHLLKLLEKKKDEKECKAEFDPQIMAAFLASAALGWFLYEPFLIAGTGMQDRNKDEIHEEIIEILEEILQKLC
ncbi:TetR/AcrR family transcriptional regulator [soil metagenome]